MSRAAWGLSLVLACALMGCEGGGSGGSDEPAGPEPIAGTWKGQDWYGSMTVIFNEDGSFTATTRLKGSDSGTYSYDGTNVFFEIYSGEQHQRYSGTRSGTRIDGTVRGTEESGSWYVVQQ